MSSEPVLNIASEGDALNLRPSGSWTATHASALEHLYETVSPKLSRAGAIRVDLSNVGELDTLGAWLLEKIVRHAPRLGPPQT